MRLHSSSLIKKTCHFRRQPQVPLSSSLFPTTVHRTENPTQFDQSTMFGQSISWTTFITLSDVSVSHECSSTSWCKRLYWSPWCFWTLWKKSRNWHEEYFATRYDTSAVQQITCTCWRNLWIRYFAERRSDEVNHWIRDTVYWILYQYPHFYTWDSLRKLWVLVATLSDEGAVTCALAIRIWFFLLSAISFIVIDCKNLEIMDLQLLQIAVETKYKKLNWHMITSA